MQSIRKRLALASTKRRLRALWLDYKKAAGLGDAARSASHLGEFLDSLNTSMREQAANGAGGGGFGFSFAADVDTLFEDWSEVLTALLDLAASGGGGGATGAAVGNAGDSASASADRHMAARTMAASVADKSLRVAEAIVRDERYRDRLQELPRVGARLLEMLAQAGSVERQRLLIRVLDQLTSTVESSMDIGRMQGFRKILQVRVSGCAGPWRCAVGTTGHLLHVLPTHATHLCALPFPVAGSCAAACRQQGCGAQARSANHAAPSSTHESRA